jgi:exo-beta-1,3-glucanase (GH17 family)
MENGLAYGPFRDGQGPDIDIYPSVDQLQEDLRFLSHITKKIRIYGTRGTFSKIPSIAKGLGIAVAQGVYLNSDVDENKKAIASALQLARNHLIDTIIVGNEELTGSLVSKNDLLEYIQLVKHSVPPDVKVSTAEVSSVWRANPDLAKDVDFVTAHFYPFWEQHPIAGAGAALLQEYNELRVEFQKRYPGRNLQVVVGETGWPSGRSSPRPGLVPSAQEQRKYSELSGAVRKSEAITLG